MINLEIIVAAFSSFIVLGLSLRVLTRVRNLAPIGLAAWGLACVAFWLLASLLYEREIPDEIAPALMLAMSIYMLIDRRSPSRSTTRDDSGHFRGDEKWTR